MAAATSLHYPVSADVILWCSQIAPKASDFVAMALVLVVDWLSHPGEAVHSPLTVEYWLQSDCAAQRRVSERRVPKTHQSLFTLTHQFPSSLLGTENTRGFLVTNSEWACGRSENNTSSLLSAMIVPCLCKMSFYVLSLNWLNSTHAPSMLIMHPFTWKHLLVSDQHYFVNSVQLQTEWKMRRAKDCSGLSHIWKTLSDTLGRTWNVTAVS